MSSKRESGRLTILTNICRRRFMPLLSVAVVVAALSILSWGVKARFATLADKTSTSGNVQPSLMVQSGRRETTPIPTNIQVETFRLGVNGFEPKQIERRPGPFVLGIDNYDRFGAAAFELVHKDGNRVHEIKWPIGQNRYRKLMNLPPGNYLLRDVNHPDTTAQITIGK